jgi:hypothetical protein
MEDLIHQLPTDKIPPTQEEKEMISWLYLDPKDSVKKTVKVVGAEFQTVLGVGVLFFLMTLPQADKWVGSFFPLANHSSLIMSGIKTFLFVLFAWVLLNAAYLFKK